MALATPTIGSMVRVPIMVSGMTCAGCAERLERALNGVPHVVDAHVNAGLDQAELVLAPGAAAIGPAVEAVRRQGFGVIEDRIELAIEGMTCAGCAGIVERALTSVPGVISADVNLAIERADVAVARGSVERRDLISAINAAGYQAACLQGAKAAPAAAEDGARREHIDFLLAAVFTLPLVLPMVAMLFGQPFHWPVWVELVLATPVQLWIGRRFYSGAWRAWCTGSGSMDQLVALGTSAAYGYSLWLVVNEGSVAAGQLYFEAAAVIITLILGGKLLEARAKRSASAALRELMALQPARARLLRGGQTIEVGVDEVARGDVVEVRPGERVPVDGTLVTGESELDESLISGESMPVAKRSGDTLVAGSVNGTGLLRLRTERIGKDTTLAAVAALVRRAQSGKAPVQRLVDRISGIFVPTVLLIAAVTFAVWLALGGGLEQSLVSAISVLVIACPCALGLATPTALVAGTGAAAKAGILIRDIETLERAHALEKVVFDKTGTLTEGQPKVTAIAAVDGNEDALLRLAATAQNGSEHPLGKAIVAAAEARGWLLGMPDRLQAVVGAGIEVDLDGEIVRIGRSGFVGATDDDPLNERADAWEKDGQTVVWVASNAQVLGLLALADALRADAESAVDGLRRAGLDVVMLTGDNPGTAERIAGQVGIARYEAGLIPADKARVVSELASDGRQVAMVGDGVNDAPALAAASVGFAMGGGAAVASEAAGITLMRPKPSLILPAIEVAKRTHIKIKQNLFWAFAYNVVGIPIAAMGWLDPAVAGAAMAFSSISVVTNALLLKRWQPRGVQ